MKNLWFLGNLSYYLTFWLFQRPYLSSKWREKWFLTLKRHIFRILDSSRHIIMWNYGSGSHFLSTIWANFTSKSDFQALWSSSRHTPITQKSEKHQNLLQKGLKYIQKHHLSEFGSCFRHLENRFWHKKGKREILANFQIFALLSKYWKNDKNRLKSMIFI